jgi:hypothetical protein
VIEQTADKTRISCGLVRDFLKEETMEKQWLLHSGKAPCHISLAVQQFLVKNQIPPILLSQHSPDITACDFWVFLRLRIGLKGNCFASAELSSRSYTHPKRGLADDSASGAPLYV